MSKLLPALVALLGAMTLGSAQGSGYVQTNLVASHSLYAPTFGVDENLVNPWGIALRPPGAGGHIWTSNAGTGTTTTYIGDANVPLFQDGLKVVPIVTSDRDFDLVQTASDAIPQPTGQVYNAASDVPGQPVEFYVEGPAINYNTGAEVGVDAGAAKFLFVTIEGTINAWRTSTNPGMVEAVVVKDYSREAFNYSFTGVGMTADAFTLDAVGNHVADNRLFVADFGRGNVRVYDNQWSDVTDPTKFQRPADLPAVWHPFNVQQLADGRIYVAWAENALEIDEPSEEIPGAGFGRIVAYDRHGNMLQDYSQHANLNAPWGMAIAPADFGEFSGALLVANFGGGTIAGYNVATGAELGYLRDANGEIFSIDGIWGLAFGNGVSLGDSNALYFTAGPIEDTHGLFGSLRASSPRLAGDFDGDHDVDGTDFILWQRGQSHVPLSGVDLARWRSGFGSASPSVLAPEPSAILQTWAAGVVAWASSRRRTG
jgi:uncharacterized protein (TIGR03118 family)